jgi:hypothetical protein
VSRMSRRSEIIISAAIISTIAGACGVNTANADCIETAVLQSSIGGDFPHQLKFHGQHYSRICDCGGVISGAETISEEKSVYCTIGSQCRCGTYNGRPWLGRVISEPSEPIPEYP